jgi:putative phosphoserine phosphatase/1-acylglycerol-3-phosphate O-acyltransferase
MQAGVPVVPIVIHNAGDVAPKGDFVFRSATVEVDVLPPVDTSRWRRETVEEHLEEVRDMFLATLGQLDKLADDFPAPVLVSPAPRRGVRKKKPAKKASARKQAVKKAGLKKAARKKTRNKSSAAGTQEKPSGKKKVSGKKTLKKKALKKKRPTRKKTSRKNG